MKKRIYILLIALLSVAALQAQPAKHGNAPQPKHPSMEEFFQMKLDFIISDLKLSEADSARFAPIYREYQQAKGELMRSATNSRAIGRKMMKKETITDQDYLTAARGELDYKIKDAELTKTWFAKFESVLSPQQLFTLIRAEEHFAAEMMNRHTRRGGESQPQPKHGK